MLELVKTIKTIDFSQLVGVYRESLNGLHAEQDFYYYLLDFFGKYDGIYALWTVDGIYCAALRLEPYRDGYLISGVETAPGERRKGYAKCLLSAVLRYASQNGLGKIYSHIANTNSVSIRLHQDCGFQKILDYAVYIDGSVYHSSSTYCYEV